MLSRSPSIVERREVGARLGGRDQHAVPCVIVAFDDHRAGCPTFNPVSGPRSSPRKSRSPTTPHPSTSSSPSSVVSHDPQP